MDQTLSSVLAKFAAETTHADIPDQVRKAALWHIVDTIGVCIAGASPHEESGQVARRHAAYQCERFGNADDRAAFEQQWDRFALDFGRLGERFFRQRVLQGF